MNEDEGTTTDAVHHRLVNQAKITATALPYECYNCLRCFSTLEDLARHSIDNPSHSEEICLKCRTSVTVFYQSKQPVRLHICQKLELRHLNPELHLHSCFLASKLQLLEASQYVSVINCDIQSCHASFEPSATGIYKFLKHVNKHKHSTLPNCKKCSLPDFQMTFEGSRTISHYCSKLAKVVCVVKNCHATFV